MELSQEQFESIVEEVTKRLVPVVRSATQSAETSSRAGELSNPAVVILPPEFYRSQREISDRVVRLEERFVQFDNRFETMQSSMDKRFEEMQSSMDNRFQELQHHMDKRFEAVDKRFESVEKRFEAVDRRFEALDRRFNGVVALISVSTAIVGGLVVLFQVL